MPKFKTISPVDGSVYVEREVATDAEIEAALERAARTRAGWRALPLEERQALVQRAVDYLVQRADLLAEELTWQMGRPIAHTPFEITRGFKERADYMLEVAPRALADFVPQGQPGIKRFIRREPLGTVLVLAPWNYPWLTSVNSVVPALVAGNTVILKMSTQTPLVAERYQEAFDAAGLPEGVFQYLHTGHKAVARMIADERIDFVAFTGSVPGGHAVVKAASDRFIGTGLELGGKDPAYVMEDADLDFTVENTVDGAFFNAGQSCCAIERIYVHEKIYDEFVERYVELVKQYKLGDPTDPETTLGPLVRTSAADWVREQIAEATSKGARALIDPALFPAAKEGTPYLAPQVLVDVNHQMSVMTEETFGPVVGIMKVSGDEEALESMNDSQYGLTASLWTRDLERAERLGARIETGTVFMNRADYLDPALAWTGVKDTGRGITLSELGYHQLTRVKSYHLRRR
ncbi:MAG TPA: aldehyde dehydrogenase family protein [Oceanithermus profundus]|uniref:Aldehyde dehydrogenase family protein n=1 Tax=Oceanithermus profundus TaxID=187137 RepID=A0A7C4ZRA6_9DEIN|nr:aldehyde dehydrogenase family protein [Oceanithermus profundus]